MVACNQISDCPCESNCPNGCDGCENHICTPKKSVLVLSTFYSSTADLTWDFKSSNLFIDKSEIGTDILRVQSFNLRPFKSHPKTIDFSGNVNDDLRFEYEDGTDVYQSCAVTFLGEFWIFGGESGKKRQV